MFPENPLRMRGALSVTCQKPVIPKFLPIQLWWKMAYIVGANPGYFSYGSKVKLLFTVIKAVLEFCSRIATLQYNIVFSYAILPRACLSNPPRLAQNCPLACKGWQLLEVFL